MKPLYQEKLKRQLCWRRCRVKCSLGPEFLRELYSWSEDNPLHPMLAWKICDPCQENCKDPPEPPKNWRKFL